MGSKSTCWACEGEIDEELFGFFLTADGYRICPQCEEAANE